MNPFIIRDFETGEPLSKQQVVLFVVRFTASAAAAYFLYKYVDKLLAIVDPTKKQKKIAEEKVIIIALIYISQSSRDMGYEFIL